MNLENILKKASQILKKNNINSHELDAQIILSKLMGVEREYLITQINRFNGNISTRRQ